MTKPVFFSSVLLGMLVITACTQPGTSNPTSSSSDNTIKLGLLAPFTGGSARHGEWIRQGVDLAVKQVNARGGVNGRSVEIIYEDTNCQPKAGVNAANKLIDFDRVAGILGPWCSSVTLAVAPVAERAGVPMISGSANDKIKDAGDYIFRLNPGATREVKQVIGYVRGTLGGQKLAILYSNNDYGFAFTKNTEKIFTELGGQVVLMAPYDQGADDYRAHLLKVKQSGADTIYMIGYQDEYSQLLRQAKEMGLPQRFVSTLTFESPDILATAGEATEGVIYSYLFDQNDQRLVVQRYWQAYTQAYGVESEMWAAMFYDAARMMLQAIGMSQLNGTSIKDELYKIKEFEGATGTLGFDEAGEVVNTFMVKQVKGGKFIRIK